MTRHAADFAALATIMISFLLLLYAAIITPAVTHSRVLLYEASFPMMLLMHLRRHASRQDI